MTRSRIFGVVLVAVGLYGFADDFIGLPSVGRFWPMVLLVTGLYFLYSFHAGSSGKSRILTGSFLALSGLYLLFFTVGPVSWERFGGMLPLLMTFLAVSVWMYGRAHDHVGLRRFAAVLLVGSILLLLYTQGAVPIRFRFLSKLLVPLLMVIGGAVFLRRSRSPADTGEISMTHRQRKRAASAWGVFLAGTGVILLVAIIFDPGPARLTAGGVLVFGGVILIGLVVARCIDGLGVAWGSLLSGVSLILLGVDLASDLVSGSLPLVSIMAGCWLLSRRTGVTRS